MFRYRFLKSAAIALCLYGVLGFVIVAAMLIVGTSTFDQVRTLQQTLERERAALVQSLHTLSGTVKDTASASTAFQTSIDGARQSADSASKLANDTAGTFRSLAVGLNVQIFGLQPLASVAPQFDQSADQLQQLAISLGATRDTLAKNGADIGRVGRDLNQLQLELESVAQALNQPGVLGLGTQALLPFQVAFYGMCLLMLLQSAFSIVAGVALYRLQRALGTQPLFPFALRTATTTAALDGARDPVRES
jgi:hypothetical protein